MVSTGAVDKCVDEGVRGCSSRPVTARYPQRLNFRPFILTPYKTIIYRYAFRAEDQL